MHSLQFPKELLTLAREVVEAEQRVDPVDEQARAKAALTELESCGNDSGVWFRVRPADVVGPVRHARHAPHAHEETHVRAVRETLDAGFSSGDAPAGLGPKTLRIPCSADSR